MGSRKGQLPDASGCAFVVESQVPAFKGLPPVPCASRGGSQKLPDLCMNFRHSPLHALHPSVELVRLQGHCICAPVRRHHTVKGAP